MHTNNYFIHRRGNLTHERAVLVSRWENGPGDWIDPQGIVMNATGLWVGRQNCIMSFAQGLDDAGCEVTMLRQWAYRTQSRERFCGSHLPIVLEYYILGLAYGLGQMDELVRQLRKISSLHVGQVLWDTSKFYFDQPTYMYGWERVELRL